MDNQELEIKIKEIIAIDNYFDMIEAINNFEKDYKNSNFYKNTKKSLIDVVKDARIHYICNADSIIVSLQKIIDNVSIEKLSQLLDKIAEMFSMENSEIKTAITQFQDIMGK